jgi:hypothetical protein
MLTVICGCLPPLDAAEQRRVLSPWGTHGVLTQVVRLLVVQSLARYGKVKDRNAGRAEVNDFRRQRGEPGRERQER